ncbi:Beta-1,3-galactosyltransferase 2 [Bagarius yarrelli]|uniref:Beta-1,3-galactosyltransferase 2 n=1 Tax=Bagarius yarrelli TaxID=175774 RepID=A0A556TTX3_BAGYA|nr:Beta-1,3-galactosyltransferase 2 [Bagarius yarrelli]
MKTISNRVQEQGRFIRLRWHRCNILLTAERAATVEDMYKFKYSYFIADLFTSNFDKGCVTADLMTVDHGPINDQLLTRFAQIFNPPIINQSPTSWKTSPHAATTCRSEPTHEPEIGCMCDWLHKGTACKVKASRRPVRYTYVMACIKKGLKVCYVFLLLAVFIGLALINISDFFKPSKALINTVASHLRSFYLPTYNRSYETLTKHQEHTAGEHTSKIIETEISRLHTTEVTTRITTTTTVPTTQSYHEAYPRNYHFLLDEPDVCKQKKPFLVLMVPVAPQQLEARNAIRNTWGNESIVQGKKISVFFMLGLPKDSQDEKQRVQLSLESQQYHDLIQSNFMDTYRNLTTKTMIIFDWLATHCPQASYAMKVDSDMFLNLENLMSLLLAPATPKENYITGMIMSGQNVVRNPSSKWYVPKELYPKDIYPAYLLGMGYVFSNDLPQKLVKVSKDIRPFFIEDAYVGECLKKLGISPSTPPDPSRFKTYYRGKFNYSHFSMAITTILGSPQQLVTFWQNLKRPT